MTEDERLYQKYEHSVLHESALKSLIEDLQHEHKRSISDIELAKDRFHQYIFEQMDDVEKVKLLVQYSMDTSNFIRNKQQELLSQFNCVYGGFMSSETNEIRPVYIYSRLCGRELKRTMNILHLLHPYDLYPHFCNETQRGSLIHVITSKCEYKVSMNDDGSYWVIKDLSVLFKTTSSDDVVDFIDRELYGEKS